MDPKLLFWTVALADLAAVCGFALFGVRCIRRGEVARHQRSMMIASLLVLSFLLSYVLKLQFLGREDMAVWSVLDVWVLRIHETFVLLMVLAGSLAWLQAQKILGTRLVTHDAQDPAPDPKTVRIHRLAGRVAVFGAIFGFLSAVGVLAGMYTRAFGAPAA